MCDSEAKRRPCERARERRRNGRTQAPDRAGQSHARILPYRGRPLLQQYQGAEAGNEHGRRRGNPVPAEARDVAHLVNVNREHEPKRKFPAIPVPVKPHRSEHGGESCQVGEAQQQQFSLGGGEQEDDLELPQEHAERAELREPFAPV